MAKKVENNVGKVVNRGDIIKAMSEKSKSEEVVLSQKECSAALNYFRDCICEVLATGARVQISGMFSIKPSYRSARKGNNVVTKQVTDIPETVVLSIKTGNILRESIKDLDKGIVKAIKAQKTKKAE